MALRTHRVTITITFDTELSMALSVLTQLNEFLQLVRGWQVRVDCQVHVAPLGLLSPEIAAAIAEAEGRGEQGDG